MGALALASAARRGGQNDVLKKLKVAAVWLYEDDSEWVEGGCADVSGLLLDYAKAVRLEDVHVKSGWASRSANAKKGFPHVWMSVQGQHFDPVAYAQGIVFKTYMEDEEMAQLAILGSYLDPDDDVREGNDFRLEALVEALP